MSDNNERFNANINSLHDKINKLEAKLANARAIIMRQETHLERMINRMIMLKKGK